MAEYWNVCTRPATARAGLGLTTAQADFGVRVIERMTLVLSESPLAYHWWKRLVQTYGVQGVQVHDARLVAQMISFGITHVATFNVADFKRYSEVTALDAMNLVPP